MKFVKVDKIPNKTRGKKQLMQFLDEFMNANTKVAKIELSEGDYKSPYSAGASLSKASKSGGYPITVYVRKGVVYLERKDI